MVSSAHYHVWFVAAMAHVAARGPGPHDRRTRRVPSDHKLAKFGGETLRAELAGEVFRRCWVPSTKELGRLTHM